MSIDGILLDPAFIVFECIVAIIIFAVLAYRFSNNFKLVIKNNDAKWSYLYLGINGVITWYLIVFQNLFTDPFGIVRQILAPAIGLTTIVLLLMFASRFRI